MNTLNPLLSPPRGLFFQGRLSGEGGLFYLAKTVVSVLYKDVERKVEKDMKLENKYSGSSSEPTPSGYPRDAKKV